MLLRVSFVRESKTLSIVDRDYIEFSNLQRQTLFTEEDANTMLPKVVAAERHLKALRHDLKLNTLSHMSIIIF